MSRESILREISEERTRQDEQHGPQRDLPVVLGSNSYGLSERAQRATYERRKAEGCLSHMDIILEELAETIHALSVENMREELIQTAACLVKALEAFDHQHRQPELFK